MISNSLHLGEIEGARRVEVWRSKDGGRGRRYVWKSGVMDTGLMYR